MCRRCRDETDSLFLSAPRAEPPIRTTHLQGAARLAVQATVAITDIVENMHRNIARVPWVFGDVPPGRTRGITGLVYRNVRRVTGWVGSGLDLALQQLQPLIDASTAEGGGSGHDAVLAVLNGVLGDYLDSTGNPLAIPMQVRRDGAPLPQAPGGRVLLMIHGLCMNDRQWLRNGHDHGALLAAEFGYERAYLYYNSGRHVSTNGRELADLLERWIDDAPEPVTELAILGFSMGGLLARSACHYAAVAGHRWPQRLDRLVFLGTPHLGAPLERGGNWLQSAIALSPYSAPLAALGKLRSAGITDLRHGSLLDEDWEGVDRFHPGVFLPRPLPLPPDVRCATLAATTGQRENDLSDRMLGDGLVPVASALGRHTDPQRVLSFAPERQWVGYGMHHLDLLDRPEVHAALRAMFAA